MTTRVADPSALTTTQIILRLLLLNSYHSRVKKLLAPDSLVKTKIKSSPVSEAIEQLKTIIGQQQGSDDFFSNEKSVASQMDPFTDDHKIKEPDPEHEIKILIKKPQTDGDFVTETKSTNEPPQKTVEPANEEGIIVQQAGIVLLHPFLNLFFKDRQLVNDGKFISPIEKLKALGLLHYLATGDTIIPEYQLVVAKTICDHPLEGAVPASIELTQEDLAAADDLLREVVAQWSILKNTGIQTLREEFLKRNGKLSFKDETHLLQVETRSIDLLLEHLPWPMSFIKLPWMKNMMKIVWR